MNHKRKEKRREEKANGVTTRADVVVDVHCRQQ